MQHFNESGQVVGLILLSLLDLCYMLYIFLALVLLAASGAYNIGDWCLSGCLSSKLFQFATPTVFSDSHEPWHTWSTCQNAQNFGTYFQNFAFKIFGKFKTILNQQQSYLGRQPSSLILTLNRFILLDWTLTVELVSSCHKVRESFVLVVPL